MCFHVYYFKTVTIKIGLHKHCPYSVDAPLLDCFQALLTAQVLTGAYFRIWQNRLFKSLNVPLDAVLELIFQNITPNGTPVSIPALELGVPLHKPQLFYCETSLLSRLKCISTHRIVLEILVHHTQHPRNIGSPRSLSKKFPGVKRARIDSRSSSVVTITLYSA